MSTIFTRRTILVDIATTLAAPRIARSAPVDLVLGTNGDGATLLNSAIAEKSAPSMDATVCFQGGRLVGQQEGIFEKIDYNRIPHIDTVYTFLRDPDDFSPFLNFTVWNARAV